MPEPESDLSNTTEHATAVISDDPLRNFALGESIRFERVTGMDSDAGAVAQRVINWGHFQGAVLAVGVTTAGASRPSVIGSAAMIAPGLAVSATHLLDGIIEQLRAGAAGIVLFGLRADGLMDVWRANQISYEPSSDLACFGLELISDISREWFGSTFVVTTRTPKVEERVFIVGFRAEELPGVEQTAELTSISGSLYTATGTVANVYYPIRDRILMPFPTIEVECGSLGGMSGGAVLDSEGALLGVISRGFEVETGDGPTFAAWILGALGRRMTLTWPPGVHAEAARVMDVAGLALVGREAVRARGDDLDYKIWFDPTRAT